MDEQKIVAFPTCQKSSSPLHQPGVNNPHPAAVDCLYRNAPFPLQLQGIWV
jgi:hypothetical protein